MGVQEDAHRSDNYRHATLHALLRPRTIAILNSTRTILNELSDTNILVDVSVLKIFVYPPNHTQNIRNSVTDKYVIDNNTKHVK